jgi:HD superfamily phosphohydrolase
MHEIRDPIHGFIRLDSDERELVNSQPYQRLREIHQLALTYLVYPGATHKRFEHCLGVMELASRIYDVATDPENLHHDSVRKLVPRYGSHKHTYWRTVLRAAALCHDLGHLPFSHAAEKELLPAGWSHERLSMDIIRGDLLRSCFGRLKIEPEDVVKVALGPKEYPNPETLTDWEAILAEMIVGDVFGADRIDYLLRDSLHAGVSYGRFDHFRLVDTLRILPRTQDQSQQPTLGIDLGGLQAAESLLWARYFMYTQLYFHPVRRIYDKHLIEFLKAWLPAGRFDPTIASLMGQTDSIILSAMRAAADDDRSPAHTAAKRIMKREHFRLVYQANPADLSINKTATNRVERALKKKFGSENIRRDQYAPKSQSSSFPVYGSRDGRIQDSYLLSPTLQTVPTFTVDYVFIDCMLRDEALLWLAEERERIIGSARNTE